MADRVIQRNDTAARWQSVNPVLATGEIGIEIDGAKGYKIGDGKTRWNDLPYPANPTNVVQELGNNENAVPSQKLVTEKLSELGSKVSKNLNNIAEGLDIEINNTYKGYADPNTGYISIVEGYEFAVIEINQSVYSISVEQNSIYSFLSEFDYSKRTFRLANNAALNSIKSGEPISIVPSLDAKYLYILTVNENISRGVKISNVGINDINKKVSQNIVKTDSIEKDIDFLSLIINGGNLLDIATIYNGFFTTTTISTDTNYKFAIIPTNGINNIQIKTDTSIVYCFIDEFNYSSRSFKLSEGESLKVAYAENEYILNVPNSRFIYIQTFYDGANVNLTIESLGLNIKPKKQYRVSVIGDSYSAYKGWNSGDDGYAYYDDADTRGIGISSVTQMWWYKFIKDNGHLFEKCNAWGGTTICNTGYDSEDYSQISFISDRKDNIGNPDLLFIFGGTNDAWANSPLGEYKYSGWTDDDLKTFRPAVAYLIDYMQLHHPNMEIIVVVNTTINSEYQQALNTVASHYNIPCVLPSSIAVKSGHPTAEGMNSIASAITL